MSEAESTPEAATRTGFAGLPTWLRIGIVAAATAVAVLIISVIIRIVLQTPVVPLGEIAADDLLPGSCLVQPGAAQTYTVVPCTQPHQQQIVASVDLAFPGVLTYSADASLATYAGFTCDRLLEYRLYLPTDLVKTDFNMAAISPPTLAEYQSGDTTTLCAILDDPELPTTGGVSEDLTGDLYRPIPK